MPPRELEFPELVQHLLAHPLYEEFVDEESLRMFMRSHVFSVWDFQSLLKALQRIVTCVDVPWFPTADPRARRLVNELVLDEESDELPGGGYLSHFELYLRAMEECGADTGPIGRFLRHLQQGQVLDQALAASDVPAGVAAYVKATMIVAKSGQAHRIAAAFAYGRESIIPGMFHQLVARLANRAPDCWSLFRYYLERHVGQDAEKHAPLARALVERLCGTDQILWAEAEQSARSALEARIRLWDDIRSSITSGGRRHESVQD